MADPLVPVPEFTDVDGIKVPNALPFYYDAIRSMWAYFPADKTSLARLLKPYGFKPALFEGQAYVNLNIQNFAGLGNNMVQATNTMEFNVIAYPIAAEKRTAKKLTFDEYLAGGDQTKTIGNYRINVMCDNAFAVAVGIRIYGEPKIQGSYDYNVPSLSVPGTDTWSYICRDAPADQKPKDMLSLKFDLRKWPSKPSNITELMEMGFYNKRPIALRWPIHGLVTTYEAKGRAVKVKLGPSKAELRDNVARIIGDTPATRIQVYQSSPVVSTNQAIYLDI